MQIHILATYPPSIKGTTSLWPTGEKNDQQQPSSLLDLKIIHWDILWEYLYDFPSAE